MAATIEHIDFHGRPALRLRTKAGAAAVVSLHGAQVLSWTPPGGADRLYLSPQAVFDGRTAIRGGIPLCFPQFADLGSLPQHGFALELIDFSGVRGKGLVTLALLPLRLLRAFWQALLAHLDRHPGAAIGIVVFPVTFERGVHRPVSRRHAVSRRALEHRKVLALFSKDRGGLDRG